MKTTPINKPKLFIGSSAEGLQIAKAVAAQMADFAESTIWKDGAFRPNDANLEALIRSLDYYDFAVFVLTPDDEMSCRGRTGPCPRDNVIFEFGLFLGRLGRARCFAVASDAKSDNHDFSLKLPSDLHGIVITRYETGRQDGNFRAAVSGPCDLIASEIQKNGFRINGEKAGEITGDKKISNSKNAEQEVDKSFFAEIGESDDDFVAVESFGRRTTTDWFHSERFTQAFPGLRGSEEITDPAEAVERLMILLQRPLRWIWRDNDGSTSTEPIWWWRGYSSSSIIKCIKVSPVEILVDYMELPISRLIAVNSRSYWQSFVYIETKPKLPTGLYDRSPTRDDRYKKEHGYIWEEYGYFQGHFVNRAEYDDGAAIINGKPQNIDGVELRARYLTPYNMIIAPHQSPINNGNFGTRFEELMNAILRKDYSVNDLTKLILELPKNH